MLKRTKVNNYIEKKQKIPLNILPTLDVCNITVMIHMTEDDKVLLQNHMYTDLS